MQLLIQVLVNRPAVQIDTSFVARKNCKHKTTELDCNEHSKVHVLQRQMSLQRMFHVEAIARSYQNGLLSNYLLQTWDVSSRKETYLL